MPSRSLIWRSATSIWMGPAKPCEPLDLHQIWVDGAAMGVLIGLAAIELEDRLVSDGELHAVGRRRAQANAVGVMPEV